MTAQVSPELLIARLSSENARWRLDAEARLLALGPAAVAPLLQALRHPTPSVRMHAVHALAHLRDERAIPGVVRMLADTESHSAVAIAAEKALVEWGSPVKAALLDAARTGTEQVRARALRALGGIGGEELVPALQELLPDPHPSVRTQAAVALASILGVRAVDLISPLLNDADKWVRYGVAEALVRQGCVRGEATLREALEDPEEQDPYLRSWAEELLDEIAELRRTGRVIK